MPEVTVKIKFFLPVLLLFLALFVIFWQIPFKQAYPFPGNFLLAWFEPYKTQNTSGGFILLPHKPVAEDTFRLIYPFKALALDLIKRGQFPLWNPYSGSGMPLLAAINIGYLDPLNILFLLFPSYLAWSLIIVIQTLLVGLATFFYSRSIKLSIQASFLTSLIFALSGPVITRVIFTQYCMGLALFPFILYLIEKYRDTGKRKYSFFLAPSVGFLIFSTHPQYVVYILFFIICYLLARLKNQLFTSFLFILLGILFASVQLFPAVEIYRQANLNSESSAFIFQGSLVPLQHFISLIIPNYFGSPSTYNYWEKFDYVETSVSIGLIPCLLAIFGFLNIKKQFLLRKIYTFTLAITIFLTLDWFIIRFIYGLNIPLFSIGVPTRIFFLTTFSIAVLAGFGYEYIGGIDNKNKKPLKTLIVFILLAALLLAVTLYNAVSNAPCPEIMKNCRITSLRNTGVEFVGLIAASTAIGCFLFRKSIGRHFRFGIILIVYILGIYNSYKFLPFSPKETFFPKSPVIEAIRSITGNDRTFGLGDATVPTDFATQFRFYDPNYYHPFYIKRYGELVNYANNEEYPPQMLRSSVELVNQESLSKRKEFLRNRLFSLLSVNYLLFKKNGSSVNDANVDRVVWENDNWYLKERREKNGRVHIVRKIEVAKNEKQTLAKLFDPAFDFSTTAVLEQKVDLKEDKDKTHNQKENVRIKNYRENEVIIETETFSESLLVLTDNYYAGWKAYIDNKEVPIFRTNYTFRGVKIPDGIHIVRFIYDPISFKLGLFASLGSVILMLFLSVLYAKIHL